MRVRKGMTMEKKLKIIEYIDPKKAIKKGFSGHHVR